MTLLGGLGTLWGPITGAVLLVGIDTYLASLGPLLSTLQGFVFVLCVMYCPQGIWGWLSALRFRLRPAAYSSQVDAAASPSNHR
jgi:branched-chain amino acid transport system permease protein